MMQTKNKEGKKTKAKGFWEWVQWYSNWCRGCKRGCLYCYQMLNEVCRYHRIASAKDWTDFRLKKEVLNGKIELKEGIGMLPTTHDIFPEILDESIEYLLKHLQVGNKLLIVSKPEFQVIKAICNDLAEYKEQIQLRFTITTTSEDLINFWEPNAPSFTERLKSLKYAFYKDFNTSVSIEPFLDRTPLPLIEKINGFASIIWVGPMNHLKHVQKIVPPNTPEFKNIEHIASIHNLIKIIRTINSELTPELKKKILYKETFDKARALTQNQSLDKWRVKN